MYQFLSVPGVWVYYDPTEGQKSYAIPEVSVLNCAHPTARNETTAGSLQRHTTKREGDTSVTVVTSKNKGALFWHSCFLFLVFVVIIITRTGIAMDTEGKLPAGGSAAGEEEVGRGKTDEDTCLRVCVSWVSGLETERECCLLVLNLVSSTLPCTWI
jgi:hypothetical protein